MTAANRDPKTGTNSDQESVCGTMRASCLADMYFGIGIPNESGTVRTWYDPGVDRTLWELSQCGGISGCVKIGSVRMIGIAVGGGVW
jgi:hypothetical protein